MAFCQVGESWEKYCQRKTMESKDKVRLYRGMEAVIPLLRAILEAEDIDLLLSEMAIRNYTDARKKLIQWLHEHYTKGSVEPILRAFDTYSV